MSTITQPPASAEAIFDLCVKINPELNSFLWCRQQWRVPNEADFGPPDYPPEVEKDWVYVDPDEPELGSWQSCFAEITEDMHLSPKILQRLEAYFKTVLPPALKVSTMTPAQQVTPHLAAKPEPGLHVLPLPAPAKPTWLWRKFVPNQAITIIEGEPGVGKSTIVLDIAARASRGYAMPPAPGQPVAEPRRVFILSAEDDQACTIRPRLDAAAANIDNIRLVTGTNTDEPIALAAHLTLLRKEIVAFNASLCVIDPIMAYTGKVDTHKDSEVRSLILHKMKDIAIETNCAFILVRHWNKGNALKAINRGAGSAGIGGQARAVFAVGKHPDEPGKFLFAPVKCNLCKPPKSLVYAVEQIDPADEDSAMKIGWVGESDYTADDLCQPLEPKEKAPSAEQLSIINYLASAPKPWPKSPPT